MGHKLLAQCVCQQAVNVTAVDTTFGCCLPLCNILRHKSFVSWLTNKKMNFMFPNFLILGQRFYVLSHI